MMAHEMPIGVHERTHKSTSTKTKKAAEGSLPNGQKVDFGGTSKKEKSKKNKKNDSTKLPAPTMPDGSAAIFDNKTPVSTQSLLNGEKPMFQDSNPKKQYNANAKPKQNKKKDKKPEEVYAGSSFHSSPEALNLPKPSFKSPKTSVVKERDVPVTSTDPISPPQYPVTAYPPGSGFPMMAPVPVNYAPQHPPPLPQQYVQPGFQYQFNNGNLVYQYPNFPPPQPGYSVLTSHFQPGPVLAQAPPVASPIPTQANAIQGQKISFSELLGSNK